MKFRNCLLAATAALSGLIGSPTMAQSVYLNRDNITVAVGPGTSAGSFNNTFANGATIEKVIDAPSATASEIHDQQTHIWFTASSIGGGLQLLFDLQVSYNIGTLHFWNYDGEGFDVDNVMFTFFDSANLQVGSLSVSPALGSTPAIFAQDIPLAAPLNVRYVTAFLTGSNGQVDFQNIGFTAVVPEPTVLATLPLGFAVAVLAARRRLQQSQARRLAGAA